MTSSLPQPIGPLSHYVVETLRGGAVETVALHVTADGDPLDVDLQLALYIVNELHYTGWVGLDDRLEWCRGVVTIRDRLNEAFERRLRGALPSERCDPRDEAHRLLALEGPSISRFLRDEGTIEQVRESMILRTPYQGKEADPHTFAMPRFIGTTKRVLCEIQSGEYGVGHRRSHAELFADALDGLGLDPTCNVHIDRCTGPSLATSNLVTLGSMQRRLRGVVLGQLSLFEMDSVVPNQAMVECCDRLRLNHSVRPFFHVHVLADAEHEQMVEAAFLTEYPSLEPDQIDNVLLGMRAQSLIDRANAAPTVSAWRAASSALRSTRAPLAQMTA